MVKNIECLTAVAEWLEEGAPPKNGVSGFSMGHLRENGIVCIYGAIEEWYGGEAFGECMEGIETKQVAALIMPKDWQDNPKQYTPAWAARTIRHLIATGEVDWLGNEHPKENP